MKKQPINILRFTLKMNNYVYYENNSKITIKSMKYHKMISYAENAYETGPFH